MNISITISLLLKNKKPPLYYGYIEYMNNLKSSPSPTSGYNLPSINECYWNDYKFKEITIPENLKIKNDILGLIQVSLNSYTHQS
jgi:hypothetical protein